MKMLVFERPIQRDLPELCKPNNNFSRGTKVFALKNVIPMTYIFEKMFVSNLQVMHLDQSSRLFWGYHFLVTILLGLWISY